MVKNIKVGKSFSSLFWQIFMHLGHSSIDYWIINTCRCRYLSLREYTVHKKGHTTLQLRYSICCLRWNIVLVWYRIFDSINILKIHIFMIFFISFSSFGFHTLNVIITSNLFLKKYQTIPLKLFEDIGYFKDNSAWVISFYIRLNALKWKLGVLVALKYEI